MASVPLRTLSGKSASDTNAGTVDLDEQMFGIQPNVPVLHQVVTAQLAARRAGTQSTKTRAEVRGGGRKPFKQKGTGNARQGSIRAPHFSGGGVALGPKPRKYDQRTPKKMIKLALRSALSDRAAEGKVIVLDRWAFDAPSTKAAKAALTSLGIESGALVVVDRNDENTIKSFLNLQEVQLIERGELNAYDILCNEWLVFTRELLPIAPRKSGDDESLVDRARDVVGDVAETVRDVVEDVVDRVGDVAGKVAGAAKAFVHGLTSDDDDTKGDDTDTESGEMKSGETVESATDFGATESSEPQSTTTDPDASETKQ